jgi:heme-degrading monooxygenase HmoA
MFARKVSMHLKADGAAEFRKKIDGEVIPLLRKQAGFLDEITFLYPSGKEVHAFSLWETAEHAEAYNRGAYPEVTKILASVVEGAPRVQTYEVLNSTIQRTVSAVAV